MATIGNVPEINKIKQQLDKLQHLGYIDKWELPYENILTRLSAAIFFISPVNELSCARIWNDLNIFPDLQYRLNSEQELSKLKYRVTFQSIQ